MMWRLIDWLVRIVIALAFAAASLGKLLSSPGVLDRFATYGFPSGFHFVIGAIELAGAILILVPKTRRYAILLLGVIVIGAAGTHLVHDPLAQLLRPLVFGIFLAAAWLLMDKPDARQTEQDEHLSDRKSGPI